VTSATTEHVGAPAPVSPGEHSERHIQGSDGRLARGERTRRALAEALIALLEEDDESPTSKRIAERAGVSLRIVFHHFEDVESIHRAAVAIQAERHWSKVRPVDSSLDLDDRVRVLSRQRADIYEAIGPVRRAAAAMERRSETLSRELARSRAVLRSQLHQTFAPELADSPATTRRRLLDAMETASSFEAWDGLRKMGRSTTESRKTMELLMGTVLRCLSAPGGREERSDDTRIETTSEKTRTGGAR
jgi:TetR/AcrR family transcriptional regulator, regulator of autoinduction and epiphytic fitness